MRRLAAALVFAAIGAPAFAQAIAPGEAQAHVGQSVTVQGIVSDVHVTSSGMGFIDMGGRYPHNAFTGVIFSEDAGKFANLEALEGRTVAISGMVKLYRGKPEIILKDAGQLKSQ